MGRRGALRRPFCLGAGVITLLNLLNLRPEGNQFGIDRYPDTMFVSHVSLRGFL
jgi:hypothetical protein